MIFTLLRDQQRPGAGFKEIARATSLDAIRASARLLAEPGEIFVVSGSMLTGLVRGPEWLVESARTSRVTWLAGQ